MDMAVYDAKFLTGPLPFTLKPQFNPQTSVQEPYDHIRTTFEA